MPSTLAKVVRMLEVDGVIYLHLHLPASSAVGRDSLTDILVAKDSDLEAVTFGIVSLRSVRTRTLVAVPARSAGWTAFHECGCGERPLRRVWRGMISLA